MSDSKKTGDRIAKVMARAGIASRRDAERMIIEGRVAINGKAITSPALDVLPSDKVTLDGKPIDAPQPARLWLYYKPLGLVTSAKDEKGRQTVFDTMPEGMPRVMSVGRLDLNSEGLLLLTNDGELKRRLELPSTGWLRKYRVRVNGRPNEATFDPLRRGVTIEGEDFMPMDISLDKQQGANAWLTIGLREGKNREIRRAMTEVGLIVNRLIRISYGPFRLNTMKPGDVVEVKQRVLRDQLGRGTDAAEEAPTGRATRAPRRQDGHKSTDRRDDKKPYGARDGGPRKPRTPQTAAKAGAADNRQGVRPKAARSADDRSKPDRRDGPRGAGPARTAANRTTAAEGGHARSGTGPSRNRNKPAGPAQGQKPNRASDKKREPGRAPPRPDRGKAADRRPPRKPDGKK